MGGEPLDAETGMRREEILAAIKLSAFETRESIRKDMEPSLDAMRDGAQAAILTSNILHGNSALGLPGFIPTMEKWRDDMNDWRQQKDDVDDDRWDKTQAEFATIKARQSVIRRCIVKISETMKPVVKLIDWRAALIMTIAWVALHMPAPYVLKRFLSWLSSLAAQHSK